MGAGLGAVLLGACLIGLLALRRRRAFSRADREGRVLFVVPPLLAGLAAREARPSIIVKILGWLEITGTRVPVTAGPLQEIVVFLVLHPGRTFTSVQLRESIWGLGREPITQATFYKYMHQFRRAFGPGVVVTRHYRYELTANVGCDWSTFQALRSEGDAGAEEAMELVRGPVLHGCFEGKKNAPFAWAVGMADAIEDEITGLAHDLAMRLLEDAETERADSVLTCGLRCSTTNPRLRRLHLLAGSTFGGSREVGRRLEAARAAMGQSFPTDVAALERLAGELGWEPASRS